MLPHVRLALVSLSAAQGGLYLSGQHLNPAGGCRSGAAACAATAESLSLPFGKLRRPDLSAANSPLD
jgi:hypothetical protein